MKTKFDDYVATYSVQADSLNVGQSSTTLMQHVQYEYAIERP